MFAVDGSNADRRKREVIFQRNPIRSLSTYAATRFDDHQDGPIKAIFSVRAEYGILAVGCQADIDNGGSRLRSLRSRALGVGEGFFLLCLGGWDGW